MQGEHIDASGFYEVSGTGQVTGKKQLNETAEYPDDFLKAAAGRRSFPVRVAAGILQGSSKGRRREPLEAKCLECAGSV